MRTLFIFSPYKKFIYLLIFTIVLSNTSFTQIPIVGGGEDYNNWVDRPRNKADIVYNARELIARLTNATTGSIIYIDDSAIIDLNEYEEIEIKSGVTLASGRGRNGSLGAKLIRNKKLSNTYFHLFNVTGDQVRITGLRIAGPDTDDSGDPDEINTGIFINSEEPTRYANLIIDNNEIYGWQNSGIEVRNVHGVIIIQNHIHHCQYNSSETRRGYGIVVSDASEVLIQGNVFDHNRHDVACNGHPLAEYTFESNIILNGGNSHSLDVHGWHESRDDPETRDDGSYFAGFTFSFENNIILGSDVPHIFIRGNSDSAVVIKNNHFYRNCNKSIKHSRNGGSGVTRGFCLFGLCIGASVCSDVPSFIQIGYNVFEATLPHALFVSYSGETMWAYRKFTNRTNFVPGEFSGDGRQDLFTSNGGKWFLSESAKKEWIEVNVSSEDFKNLRFGDFNGDGKTDVFRKHDNKWWISSSAIDIWQYLNSSKINLNKLKFGDFNGDGATDVFYKSNNEWMFSYGGSTAWSDPKSSNISLNNLLLGDFNGDNSTDVVGTFGGKWNISYSGQSNWMPLNTTNVKANQLLVGDFDGNGVDDIFTVSNNDWYISWGGQSQWEQINTSGYSINKLILSDFNGDGKTDVAVVDKFW